MEHNTQFNPQYEWERESERGGEEFQWSEKFKENKSGRKEEEKMQITEKAPFVCWIKVDLLKWNIHQNRHSWQSAGDEEVFADGGGGRGRVTGRVWLLDESQPGLGHLHTGSLKCVWSSLVLLGAHPDPDVLSTHRFHRGNKTAETSNHTTCSQNTTQHAFVLLGLCAFEAWGSYVSFKS